MTSSHTTKTINGLKWSGLGQIIKQVLNISIGILLARLLSPEDYGLIGMITIITGFVQLFSDFGFGTALIQKKEININDLSSVFWFNLSMGAISFLGLFLFSEELSHFYENEILSVLIKWVSLLFIIQSISYVHVIILKRRLDFRSLFLVEFLGMILSGAIALIMAFNGYGVYSLVAQQIFNQVFIMIGFWLKANWKPQFLVSTNSIKSLAAFSIPLMGSSILGYIFRNLDKFLIGRFLGNHSFGLYSRANSLMIFPVSQVSGVISQVIFPSFAQIQDDKIRISSIYLKMNRFISFITFPLMAIGFLLAEPFVKILLGEQWVEIIPLFKIFTIVGAIQSIGTLIGNIFMSLGETKLFFKLNLFSGVVFLIASIIGINFGLNGVSLAYAIASISLGIPQWYITCRLINLSLGKYLSSWSKNLFITLMTTVIVFITNNTIFSSNSLWIFSQFVFLYIIAQFLFNKPMLKEVIEVIKNKLV